MAIPLLIAALITIVCIITNKISNKIGLPVLLGFIALGMIFGSDGIFKIQFTDFKFAEYICKTALIFIMFYGGFGTRWSVAKPAAVKACLLSTVGVAVTAGLTGLFCYFVLSMPILESMLIGALISSTDAASVFSILRSKKLNLKENTASLLEIESGSNDPCAYMLTLAMIAALKGEATTGSVLYLIFAQFAYGIIFGFGIAFAARYVLTHVRFSTEGFDAIFMLAVAVLSFALPDAIEGSGYLSVYIVGMVLGNSPIKNKKAMVHFFDGVTGLMEMLIFFLLGLLSFPSSLVKVLLPSLALSAFLMFVVRPIAVFGVLSPFKCSLRQQVLVSWSGLRGAASIVFSIMAVVSVGALENDIFHIIFCTVLISILLQGTLIPFMSKKLNMIDDSSNVLRTFSDYSEELEIDFVRLTVGEDNPWKDKCIKELYVPRELLFVLIIRGSERIIPNGSTRILKDDTVVVGAPEYMGKGDILFSEEVISAGSKWVGKKISDYSAEENNLVILIKRGSDVVIPRGPTDIEKEDVLVIHDGGQG